MTGFEAWHALRELDDDALVAAHTMARADADYPQVWRIEDVLTDRGIER